MNSGVELQHLACSSKEIGSLVLSGGFNRKNPVINRSFFPHLDQPGFLKLSLQSATEHVGGVTIQGDVEKLFMYVKSLK